MFGWLIFNQPGFISSHVTRHRWQAGSGKSLMVSEAEEKFETITK